MTTGIGETLREAREQRGLSLDEAAEETRIRATVLAAIEQERFDQLGGDVYTRGFIRSYAKCLGLDPEPLLQHHLPPTEPATAAETPAPLGRDPLERTPRRGIGVVVALLALMAITGLAILGDAGTDEPVGINDDTMADAGDPDAEPGDVASPGASPTPTPTPTPSTSPSPDQPDGPAEGVRVVLETTDRDVWLRALVDGDQVLTETLPPGSTETFQGQDQIRLRLGDAGAVQLTVNGESQGSLGGPGEPVWVTITADGEVTIG